MGISGSYFYEVPELASLPLGIGLLVGDVSNNRLYRANPSLLAGVTAPQVQTMIDTSLATFTPPGGSGGGFSYGGEWNAIPSVANTNVTTFDALNRCTFSGGVLTTTGSVPTAFVHNLQQVSSTSQYFQFTWPDVQSNALAVGITKNPHENLNTMLSDMSNASVFLMAFGGGCNVQIKDEGSPASNIPVSMPDVGDVVSLSLIGGYIFFNNITKNTQLIQTAPRSSIFSLVVASMGVSSVACNFALPYPLVKQSLTFNYPSDLTKTYLVSAAAAGISINNKLLNVGDFVNFVTNNSVVSNVVVSRLVTKDNIIETIDDELQDIASGLYSRVGQVASGFAVNAVLTQLSTAESALQSAIFSFLQAQLSLGSGDFYDAIKGVAISAISDEVQPGGIIDDAIQAAID